jgi:hypothetical protein
MNDLEFELKIFVPAVNRFIDAWASLCGEIRKPEEFGVRSTESSIRSFSK